MLSYVHELSYKPMMCFSPSSPLSTNIVPLLKQGLSQDLKNACPEQDSLSFSLSRFSDIAFSNHDNNSVQKPIVANRAIYTSAKSQKMIC